MGLGQKAVHLFFGHPIGAGPTLAQEPQNPPTRPVQKPNQRGGTARQHQHRGGHGDRQLFRIAQRQLLRHQLAHDQRDIGDDHHHHPNPQIGGPVRIDPTVHQRLCQPRAQGRPGQGTRQNADQSDADLNRGQKPPRMLAQPQGSSGTAALGFQRAKAGGTRGYNGQFRHGQHAIQADQAKDDAKF